jgi:hypothetical protein
MSVKNEWPTAKINFPVVNQKSVVFFLSDNFCWRPLYLFIYIFVVKLEHFVRNFQLFKCFLLNIFVKKNPLKSKLF